MEFRATLHRATATIYYKVRVRLAKPDFEVGIIYLVDGKKFNQSEELGDFVISLKVRYASEIEFIESKTETVATPIVELKHFGYCDDPQEPNTICSEIKQYKNIRVQLVGDGYDVTFESPAVLKFEPAYEWNIESMPVMVGVLLFHTPKETEVLTKMNSPKFRLLFDGTYLAQQVGFKKTVKADKITPFNVGVAVGIAVGIALIAYRIDKKIRKALRI